MAHDRDQPLAIRDDEIAELAEQLVTPRGSVDQSVSSKARRAAAMAAFTSAGDASGAFETTSPVQGPITS